MMASLTCRSLQLIIVAEEVCGEQVEVVCSVSNCTQLHAQSHMPAGQGHTCSSRRGSLLTASHRCASSKPHACKAERA